MYKKGVSFYRHMKRSILRRGVRGQMRMQQGCCRTFDRCCSFEVKWFCCRCLSRHTTYALGWKQHPAVRLAVPVADLYIRWEGCARYNTVAIFPSFRDETIRLAVENMSLARAPLAARCGGIIVEGEAGNDPRIEREQIFVVLTPIKLPAQSRAKG